MTQSYKPTFLQRFLGKNYKWWYLAKISFLSVTTYRISNLFYSLQNLMFVGTTILVWWVNYLAGSRLFEFNYIFTYFIFGIIFNSLMENKFHHQFSNDISRGSITKKMLNGSSVWGQYLFSYLGAKIFWDLDIFFWLIVSLFGLQFFIIPTDLFQIVWFILMFPITFLISYFLSIILGASAFFFTDGYGIIEFFGELKNIASGKIIPLNLFWLTNTLTYTPFAYFFYHPMQIYLGKYDNVQTSWTLLGGLAWCIVLYILAKIVFKMGLKRNESVGL